MTRTAPDPAPAEPEHEIAPQTLSLARGKVRELLSRSEGFQRLSPDEQVEIANKMVKVAGYMADPDRVLSHDQPLAGALRNTDSAVAGTARRAGADQGFAGQDFVGGAIRQGTEEFGNLVDKVDFPEFVGGLIENVFQAIVKSSIEQMRAYGEMLKSVSQSIDDFASQNISANNARDWLMETYPDTFDLNESGGDDFGFGGGGGGPRLVTRGENAEGRLRDISGEIGLPEPVTDISDREAESALVQGARRSIAKSRMQLLASMVMLGISRIVVTDGQIRAKVVFGMRGSDVAARASRASTYDRKRSAHSARIGGGFISGLFGLGGSARSSSSHVTTVSSSLDERSQSQAELKAQLSGDVRVNFKSDYMPMAELASPEMIAAIQGNAAPSTPPGLAAPQSTGNAASGQDSGAGASTNTGAGSGAQ